MATYDLIVVGAGPAGCAAALHAARAGLRVALLERRRMPRHKTCGGGVPMVAAEHLTGAALDGVVQQRLTTMRHTWRFDDAHEGRISSPGDQPAMEIWCVCRDAFDMALAQAAAQAGADVMDGLAVETLDDSGVGVGVVCRSATGSPVWHGSASHVIGADGANGVVARSIGRSRRHPCAIAAEVEAPIDWPSAHPPLTPSVMHIDYGAIRDGYAWAFPKADHINVGAGFFRPGPSGRPTQARAEMLSAIDGFMRHLGIEGQATDLRLHAHPLPLWSGKRSLQSRSGRVLLAGDAASLVNPLFGDGILNAIRSGRIAAECVASGEATSYTRRIHAELAPSLDAAARIARLFYAMPELCFRRGVRRPNATRIAAKLLCGEIAFRDVVGHALKRLRSPS